MESLVVGGLPTETLAALVGFARGWLDVSFIVFLRVGGCIAVLPAFGEATVPARIRLAVAIAFTLVITPAVADQTAVARAAAVPLYFITEPAIGLILGLSVRIFALVLPMLGAVIGQTTALAQLFGVAGAEPAPVAGQVLAVGALALAVMAGLHVDIAAALIRSYDVLPAMQFPDGALLRDWSLRHVAAAFRLAFSLSMPFLIASTIYNIALGVMNRAMPTLMVTLIGAPAQTLGAMILMAVMLPAALALWTGGLAALLADPFGFPR